MDRWQQVPSRGRQPQILHPPSADTYMQYCYNAALSSECERAVIYGYQQHEHAAWVPRPAYSPYINNPMCASQIRVPIQQVTHRHANQHSSWVVWQPNLHIGWRQSHEQPQDLRIPPEALTHRLWQPYCGDGGDVWTPYREETFRSRGSLEQCAQHNGDTRRTRGQKNSRGREVPPTPPLYTLDGEGDLSLQKVLTPLRSDVGEQQCSAKRNRRMTRCHKEIQNPLVSSAGNVLEASKLSAARAETAANVAAALSEPFASSFASLENYLFSCLREDGVIVPLGGSSSVAAEPISSPGAHAAGRCPAQELQSRELSWFICEEAVAASLRRQQLRLQRKYVFAARGQIRLVQEVGGGFVCDRYFNQSLLDTMNPETLKAIEGSNSLSRSSQERPPVVSLSSSSYSELELCEYVCLSPWGTQPSAGVPVPRKQKSIHSGDAISTTPSLHLRATHAEVLRGHLFMMSLHKSHISVCFFCSSRDCPRSRNPREACSSAICKHCGEASSPFSRIHKCGPRKDGRLAILKNHWIQRYELQPTDPAIRCLCCDKGGHWLCGPALQREGLYSLGLRRDPTFAQTFFKGQKGFWSKRNLREFDQVPNAAKRQRTDNPPH